MKPIFKFNKVYSRLLQDGEDFSREFLFYEEGAKILVLFSFGIFYIVNKGEVLNVSSFEQWDLPQLDSQSQAFEVIDMSGRGEDTFMLLKDGIVKITNKFSLIYGFPTYTLFIANKVDDETAYELMYKEMKDTVVFNNPTWNIMDMRFL